MNFENIKQKILKFLKQNENATHEDIANFFGIPLNMVYEFCDDLYADGEIEEMPE